MRELNGQGKSFAFFFVLKRESIVNDFLFSIVSDNNGI